MKTFRPRNYLEEWPMPAVKFEDDLALQVRFHFCQEWERVRMKQPLKGFDVNRYTLEEPSGDAVSDEAAWKNSVDVARLQLEYQKEKCDHVEYMIYSMDRELGSLQEKTEIINRKRKQTQEESSEKLFTTQWQALELQMKNYQIERSCEAMEKKVKVDAAFSVC
ncbi:pre-mRNA-splicing factor SPF27-like protein [Blastocystis sp. subtype 4]|uniref:pre-mRNA-splicing factor SPF27-like protein n=1 Tax=Blastocystis sp. subtype 4 TaxID=944170 RepID=UPI0007114005|nr:pre-mRNA-splicing factor SPF27-like protein [Blastocystis sp. subtype 4]KNB41903.1 pre-mRNA-splicing factor SPF27-like protein [Blastocystis sp. subtype 4]|eukprot:XP_014525346.1 pre-mRNA-splicing factor SPF27-like protein [Blastocystis sp. subtype 4]